jgi:hypothetical protein
MTSCWRRGARVAEGSGSAGRQVRRMLADPRSHS